MEEIGVFIVFVAMVFCVFADYTSFVVLKDTSFSLPAIKEGKKVVFIDRALSGIDTSSVTAAWSQQEQTA